MFVLALKSRSGKSGSCIENTNSVIVTVGRRDGWAFTLVRVTSCQSNDYE